MTTPEDDLLGGVTWVRILTLRNLSALEGIRDRLREKGVGAVIVNDEKFPNATLLKHPQLLHDVVCSAMPMFCQPDVTKRASRGATT